jgi:hypothetical protein
LIFLGAIKPNIAIMLTIISAWVAIAKIAMAVTNGVAANWIPLSVLATVMSTMVAQNHALTNKQTNKQLNR